MIGKKIGQILGGIFLYYVGHYVFGVDFVYATRDIYMFIQGNEGLIVEEEGFLVQVNQEWLGMWKIHDGIVDMPAATWLIIGTLLVILWQIAFDWESSEEEPNKNEEQKSHKCPPASPR